MVRHSTPPTIAARGDEVATQAIQPTTEARSTHHEALEEDSEAADEVPDT